MPQSFFLCALSSYNPVFSFFQLLFPLKWYNRIRKNFLPILKKKKNHDVFHWEITKLMKQGGSWKNSLFPICSCDAVSQWELWGCGHSRSLCLLCMWEPFSHLSSPFHVFLSPVNLSVTGHLLPLHSPPCYIYGVTIFTDYRSVPPYLRGLRKRTPTNEFLLMFTQSKASLLPGNMWGIGVGFHSVCTHFQDACTILLYFFSSASVPSMLGTWPILSLEITSFPPYSYTHNDSYSFHLLKCPNDSQWPSHELWCEIQS